MAAVGLCKELIEVIFPATSDRKQRRRPLPSRPPRSRKTTAAESPATQPPGVDSGTGRPGSGTQRRPPAVRTHLRPLLVSAYL